MENFIDGIRVMRVKDLSDLTIIKKVVQQWKTPTKQDSVESKAYELLQRISEERKLKMLEFEKVCCDEVNILRD